MKTFLMAVCLLGGASFAWADGVTDLGNGTSRLGNEENNTAWWTDFTEWYTIAPNKTLTLTFVNHSSKADNYANWAVEIDNNAENYEWLLMRADCFGITNGEWTGRTTNDNSTGWFKYNLNSYDWSSDDVFRSNLDGATVVMTIKRIGSELYLIEDVTTTASKTFRHYFVMDCTADKDNNLKARLTVDRAHLIINNSAPVTDSQTLPTITGTLHGLIDQKGVFGWGAHEDFTLSANSTLELNFINYSSKGENWYNWILEIQEGSNYLDLRCDNYGWGTYWDSKTSCEQTDGYWTNFQDKMDGATVNMTIVRSGANLTITAVHTPKTGDAFTQTFTHESFPAEGDVVVRLLTENACLDLLPVTATIGATGWATLYTPYALNFSGIDGLTAYTATYNTETKKVELTSVDNVPANTGVVLEGATKTYNIPIIASSETGRGALTGSATETKEYDEAYNYYYLAPNGANVQFKHLTSGSIAAGKAYLQLDKSVATAAPAFDVVFGNDVTGISATLVNSEKVNSDVYDLQGRKVMNPTKGLYIVNGRKVIIK